AAEPIHQKTEPVKERLLISNDRAVLGPLGCGANQRVTTAGKARAEFPGETLTADDVALAQRVSAGAMIHRRVENATRRRRHARSFVIVELPLHVRLHLDRQVLT